ncbi:MAG: DUF1822 family protein [Phormidesmis sp.]
MNTTNLRLRLSELLWLEPEHFQQAGQQVDRISGQLSSEPQRWQIYLNALGLFSFCDWLVEKLPDSTIEPIERAEMSYLKVDGFTLCLLVTEHVLNEQVSVPRNAIEQPDLAAHCYVVLEVLEDQEQAVIRGFLRYDELIVQLERAILPPASAQSDEYLLPLSGWDEEINHLIGYVHYSHPSTIPLPVVSTQAAEVSDAVSAIDAAAIATRLSQWLQGTLTEGWQTLESLLNSDANLAWSTREVTDTGRAEIRGGKLINLGVQLDHHPIVLLVTVVPAAEKVGINVQVLPTGEDRFLPAQLKMTLLSHTDKVLQEVVSREQDNYIQLRPFRGRSGVRFRIELALNEVKVSETFEL